MSVYQYKPLEHGDSIRVLVIFPSTDSSERLKGTILQTRLSDRDLEYEAISYTWGEDPHLHQHLLSIGSDEQEFKVGANCYTVLHYLRRKRKYRVVWIDAVSINQNNLQERASQVRIMDQIYRNAKGVVAYLGEESPGSRIVFKALARAKKMRLMGETSRPHRTDETHEEIDKLLRRPWFKRVWVLQEIFVNDSVTLMCSSTQVSCANPDGLILHMDNSSSEPREDLPFALELMMFKKNLFKSPQFNLWYLLFCSRTCIAADPRDRVIALKSLINEENSELDHLVDYSKDVTEIFFETALFLLPAIGLGLLTAARHPHERNMPSWIPDWSQNLPLCYEFFGSQTDFEEKTQPLDPTKHVIHTDSSHSMNLGYELHVTGCRYARVVSASRSFSFHSLNDAEEQMRGIFDNLNEIDTPTPSERPSKDHNLIGQLGEPITKGSETNDILEIRG